MNTDEPAIEWEDPPEMRNRSAAYNYRAIANALVEHPRQWAKVVSDKPMGHISRMRTALTARERKIEFRQAKIGGTGKDERFNGYARYNPDKGER